MGTVVTIISTLSHSSHKRLGGPRGPREAILITAALISLALVLSLFASHDFKHLDIRVLHTRLLRTTSYIPISQLYFSLPEVRHHGCVARRGFSSSESLEQLAVFTFNLVLETVNFNCFTATYEFFKTFKSVLLITFGSFNNFRNLNLEFPSIFYIFFQVRDDVTDFRP